MKKKKKNTSKYKLHEEKFDENLKELIKRRKLENKALEKILKYLDDQSNDNSVEPQNGI